MFSHAYYININQTIGYPGNGGDVVGGLKHIEKSIHIPSFPRLILPDQGVMTIKWKSKPLHKQNT